MKRIQRPGGTPERCQGCPELLREDYGVGKTSCAECAHQEACGLEGTLRGFRLPQGHMSYTHGSHFEDNGCDLKVR